MIKPARAPLLLIELADDGRRAACRMRPVSAPLVGPDLGNACVNQSRFAFTWHKQKYENIPDATASAHAAPRPTSTQLPCSAASRISSRINSASAPSRRPAHLRETGHLVGRVVPEHFPVAVVPGIEPIIELRRQFWRNARDASPPPLTSSESSNRHPNRSGQIVGKLPTPRPVLPLNRNHLDWRMQSSANFPAIGAYNGTKHSKPRQRVEH